MKESVNVAILASLGVIIVSLPIVAIKNIFFPTPSCIREISLLGANAEVVKKYTVKDEDITIKWFGDSIRSFKDRQTGKTIYLNNTPYAETKNCLK